VAWESEDLPFDEAAAFGRLGGALAFQAFWAWAGSGEL
jgi:hypothetical protein